VRGLLGELLSSQSEITVVDMEAGLEHLSRSGGTLRHVDHLLVVVEPYAKAVETARRTVRLAQELGIPRISLLANKVREASELALLDPVRAEAGVDLIAVVPYDDTARLADRAGLPPIEAAPDGILVQAIADLARSLESAWAGAAA
jgi:CO dehydrogenase maturation factor